MAKPYAKLLIEAAANEGLHMRVYHSGELPDYEGTDAKKAWEAATACDEMNLSLHERKGGPAIGWALIIPGLAPDETVADYSGDWIDRKWKEFDR